MTGDFNGDGRLDLAVANSSSNTVSILLGNANGTFQAAQNFATGAGPMSVAVGDFNKDGKLDLATANAIGRQRAAGQRQRHVPARPATPASASQAAFGGRGRLQRRRQARPRGRVERLSPRQPGDYYGRYPGFYVDYATCCWATAPARSRRRIGTGSATAINPSAASPWPTSTATAGPTSSTVNSVDSMVRSTMHRYSWPIRMARSGPAVTALGARLRSDRSSTRRWPRAT